MTRRQSLQLDAAFWGVMVLMVDGAVIQNVWPRYFWMAILAVNFFFYMRAFIPWTMIRD